MKNPKKGEIWLVSWNPSRGSEQNGIRPSLIIQNDKGNSNSNYPNTIILAISSKGKKIPFHIKLSNESIYGLEKESYIKCEQILTISKERLIKKLGRVDTEILEKVNIGINMVLEK